MAFTEGTNNSPQSGDATKVGGLADATATSAGLWIARSAAAGDGLAYKYAQGAAPYLDNGASLDRQRGNTTATLLASAARTATTAVGPLTNYNGRGIVVVLGVTAKAAATTVTIRLLDGSGNRVIAASSALAATAGATYVVQFYPGVLAADFSTNCEGKSVVVPRTFFVQAQHSDANSITYSLTGDLIL